MFQINIPINKIAQPGSALHIMLIFVSNKIDIEILISKTKFKSTFIIAYKPVLYIDIVFIYLFAVPRLKRCLILQRNR